MKLSRASSYAIAYLAHLAREKPDRPVPSHEVARELNLPERFLLKILGLLVNPGILRSIKGPNGGYSMARPAKDVTLLEIVEAVDGPIRAQADPVGGGEQKALDKRLQVVCDQVLALVRERLEKVTLAELAKRK